MGNVMENAASLFNAAAYYLKSAISLLTSNPWLLGISVFMLLFAGKSLKIGRIISAKG